jgi:dTDP-4-dehydrorhamnose 3,5-epimerase
VAIDGVMTKSLRVIPDERGRLMEMVRCDDDVFEKFGQVYMTTVNPGVVKAWHYHKIQSDNMVCVKGMLKVVLYDDREDSPSRGEVMEFFIGENNPMLVHIPAKVFHGFKGISVDETMVINTVTEAYNAQTPDEFRIDPHDNDIPYDWACKDG